MEIAKYAFGVLILFLSVLILHKKCFELHVLFHLTGKKKNFSPSQRRFLKAAYRCNKYPSSDDKKYIAERTNLTIAQVQQWFENARRRKLV